MVVAFALIGQADLHEKSIRFLRDAKDLWAPESLRAELVNVMWLWVRHRGVDPAVAIERLRDVDGLLTGLVPIADLWETALELAVARDHSPYDTLFVALAISQNTKLVTADEALLRRFPEWTQGLGT